MLLDHSRLMLDWLVKVVRRAMLRTEQTAVRPLWRMLYEVAIRLSAAYLRRGRPGAAAYVRRSLGAGDPVVGLSDIDLVIVIPEDGRGAGVARDEVSLRSRRMRARLGLLGQAIEVGAYEDADLERAVAATPAHLEQTVRPRPLTDYYGLTIRPGVHAPAADWRLVAGPDRRPAPTRAGPGYRRLAAWLELQYWWRQVSEACSQPERPDSAYLCFKVVAESARAWLWLAHAEQVARPRDALVRTAELVPEEADSMHLFLDLRAGLHRSPPAPLRETLGALCRISRRAADELDEHARAEGHTPVQLVGMGQSRLPLCDWRALVSPPSPEESLAIVAGDPGDPRALAAAVALDRDYDYPALTAGDLFVLAGRKQRRTWFRTVQCEVTDPVSFALLEEAEQARFPRLEGLSAVDTASLAVAQHAHRLIPQPDGNSDALGTLFTAARAGLFHDSLAEGAAVLPVTLEGTATLLAERYPAARGAAEAGAAGDRAAIGPLARHVSRLPAYATASTAPGVG